MEELETAHRRWLEVLLETLSCFRPQMPWDRICGELGWQLRAPVTGQFKWDARGAASVIAYPFPDWFDLTDVASRAPGRHPLALHYARTGSHAPLSTTQLPFGLDSASLEYRAELILHGIEQHVWVPIELSDHDWLVIGVCRDRRPFDRNSLALAGLGQRVVTALFRHCQELASWAKRPDVTDQAAAAQDLGLTPRQVAVLALAAQGLTAVAIGRRLHVSHRTVEQHLRNAYGRLGVSDRAAAVRRACIAGVLH